MFLLGQSRKKQELEMGSYLGGRFKVSREVFNRLLWRVRGELNRIATVVEGPFEVDVPDFIELSICIVEVFFLTVLNGVKV